MISVYVPPEIGPKDLTNLQHAAQKIRRIYRDQQKRCQDKVNALIAGDFNRHDTLWGGDHIANSHRNGEAQPLLELIIDLGLQSLPPRGTITYESGPWKSTIDLMLASETLAIERYPATPTKESMGQTTERLRQLLKILHKTHQPKLCIRKAPWDKIQTRLQQYNWNQQ